MAPLGSIATQGSCSNGIPATSLPLGSCRLSYIGCATRPVSRGTLRIRAYGGAGDGQSRSLQQEWFPHTGPDSNPPLCLRSHARVRFKKCASLKMGGTLRPGKVALAYAIDSRWRNRLEFINGRNEIIAFSLAGRPRNWTTGSSRNYGPSPGTASRYASLTSGRLRQLVSLLLLRELRVQ